MLSCVQSATPQMALLSSELPGDSALMHYQSRTSIWIAHSEGSSSCSSLTMGKAGCRWRTAEYHYARTYLRETGTSGRERSWGHLGRAAAGIGFAETRVLRSPVSSLSSKSRLQCSLRQEGLDFGCASSSQMLKLNLLGTGVRKVAARSPHSLLSYICQISGP